MESDGNQLSYGDLVWNPIYTYPVRPTSHFYVGPCKRQKSVIVLMSTVTIPNLGVKVCPPPKTIATNTYFI